MLKGLSDSSKKEELLSSVREPQVELWLPMIQFLIANQARIPLNALPEFAEAGKLWLKTNKTPLRKEVALLCHRFLTQPFDEILDELSYKEDEIVTYHSDIGWISEQTRRALTEALLSAADCIPDELASYVKESIAQQKRNAVTELILEPENCIQMALYLPDLLIEAADKILCWKPLPPDEATRHALRFRRSVRAAELMRAMTEEEQYREMCNDTSIKHGITDKHKWFPPTYDKGPFYWFLKAKPEHGLRLIHTVVNHATNSWRRCQPLDRFAPCTPLPQTIQLSGRTIELWGDEQVYSWSRTSLTSNAVVCALHALKKWLHEQIEGNQDPVVLFNKILSETNWLYRLERENGSKATKTCSRKLSKLR